MLIWTMAVWRSWCYDSTLLVLIQRYGLLILAPQQGAFWPILCKHALRGYVSGSFGLQ